MKNKDIQDPHRVVVSRINNDIYASKTVFIF